MRLLILSWRDLRHPLAGGSEVYAQNLAKHWSAAGHDVTFFCASVEGAPADEEHDGYRIVRRGGRLSVYGEARRWYKRHGRGGFDAVLDVVNTRPFLAPRWVDDAPVTALIHQVCREVWRYETPPPVALLGRYWLEPRWLRSYRDTHVLTLSKSSRESLRGYGLRRVEIVPPGVDVPTLAVGKEPDPTLIWVGRLSANKRPDHAVEAFRRLRRDLPDLRLWVVGDGPMRKRLERSAPAGTTFFGRVDQVTKHDLMARAHLLLATAVREGWGLTVSEAALLATPTAGYDVAGLRDSIGAAGGTLCEPTPDHMALAVATVLTERRITKPVGPSEVGVQTWADVSRQVLEAVETSLNFTPRRPLGQPPPTTHAS